jgi:nitroreductase
LDTIEAISTKLDVRQFQPQRVSGDIKRKVLEAARLTASSMNKQHWRFILIQDSPNLKKLAGDSRTGKWVEGADFAIVILVDPQVPGHMIDAGRVLQDMELAAWDLGVASGIYIGVDEEALRRHFAVPESLKLAAILGFGYPRRKILGKKDRKPLEEIAFSERFGQKVKASDFS